jgi:flagellar biosynthesis protein FlhG
VGQGSPAAAAKQNRETRVRTPSPALLPAAVDRRKLSLVVGKFLNLKLEYLGALPQDPSVTKAVMRQKPAVVLYPNSNFSKVVHDFADILCENSTDNLQSKKGIAQLFTNLLRSRIKK